LRDCSANRAGGAKYCYFHYAFPLVIAIKSRRGRLMTSHVAITISIQPRLFSTSFSLHSLFMLYFLICLTEFQKPVQT
jgi:hypothetical protein